MFEKTFHRRSQKRKMCLRLKIRNFIFLDILFLLLSSEGRKPRWFVHRQHLWESKEVELNEMENLDFSLNWLCRAKAMSGEELKITQVEGSQSPTDGF